LGRSLADPSIQQLQLRWTVVRLRAVPLRAIAGCSPSIQGAALRVTCKNVCSADMEMFSAVHGSTDALWIYWVGPVIGALLATLCFLLGAPSARARNLSLRRIL